MSRALYTAATGMQVQQQNVDNIANNLANSSTVGFKRTRLEFQDLLYQNMRTPGAAATSSTEIPVGLQIGLGARTILSAFGAAAAIVAMPGLPFSTTVIRPDGTSQAQP